MLAALPRWMDPLSHIEAYSRVARPFDQMPWYNYKNLESPVSLQTHSMDLKGLNM